MQNMKFFSIAGRNIFEDLKIIFVCNMQYFFFLKATMYFFYIN